MAKQVFWWRWVAPIEMAREPSRDQDFPLFFLVVRRIFWTKEVDQKWLFAVGIRFVGWGMDLPSSTPIRWQQGRLGGPLPA